MTARYELPLPWSRPPLSLNQRMHHHARARVVAEVRRTAGWLAKAARIGHHHRVKVELIYTPATRRRRDADNLVAALKPLVDGLVDAGVVADDDDEHVERAMPIITVPDPRCAARLVLVVEPLRSPDQVTTRTPRLSGA